MKTFVQKYLDDKKFVQILQKNWFIDNRGKCARFLQRFKLFLQKRKFTKQEQAESFHFKQQAIQNIWKLSVPMQNVQINCTVLQQYYPSHFK